MVGLAGAYAPPSPRADHLARATAPEEWTFTPSCNGRPIASSPPAATRARDLGLPIGLYLDIAVGVIPDGADAWSEQDALMRGLSVGAPPDLLNPAGQNWGLASFHPAALVRSDFALFRATLAASMRYAGAVRLDHVLGLNRIYRGAGRLATRRGGTYVRFPLQAMLAVIAQESVAARCLVIGEDLGTVPDGFRDIMADWGIWSYRVALFERGRRRRLSSARALSRAALWSPSTTHDLPTLSGWLAGHDLVVKRALGLDPGEDEGGARSTPASAWRRRSPVTASATAASPSFVDVARFLARTPSRLLVIAAEDVLGVVDQPNVPGTIDEHPELAAQTAARSRTSRRGRGRPVLRTTLGDALPPAEGPRAHRRALER